MSPHLRVLPVALVHRVFVHEVPDDIWEAVFRTVEESIEIILPGRRRFASGFEERRGTDWRLLESSGHGWLIERDVGLIKQRGEKGKESKGTERGIWALTSPAGLSTTLATTSMPFESEPAKTPAQLPLEAVAAATRVRRPH